MAFQRATDVQAAALGRCHHRVDGAHAVGVVARQGQHAGAARQELAARAPPTKPVAPEIRI